MGEVGIGIGIGNEVETRIGIEVVMDERGEGRTL